MEAEIPRQPHAELRQAGEDPRITAVEVGVTYQARVQNAGQRRCQRPAQSETAAAKGHVEGVLLVLLHRLGAAPDVVPPLPVVPPQRRRQIIREEDGVIIPKHHPPYASHARGSADELFRHARNADGRPEAAAGEGVRKPGHVGGDADWRLPRVRVRGRVLLGKGGIEKDEAPHAGGIPPGANVPAAVGEGPGGGGEAEDEVLHPRRCRVGTTAAAAAGAAERKSAGEEAGGWTGRRAEEEDENEDGDEEEERGDEQAELGRAGEPGERRRQHVSRCSAGGAGRVAGGNDQEDKLPVVPTTSRLHEDRAHHFLF